ncbi:alkylhydroperoxidase [Hahella sp. CCB-MM4]|uniref:carboxymuconolactone decarboxylase family protein n=1 Tax=Hahella sp. (strain CCB-MM4) TaxID=1926491 RepID=UPI000B9BB3F9|nr:carboxymuconolactone decarboxylase family protein [Hahella sp. CCB-MM4]OZG70632.1 alkylhydroperoxidase [Hahella sp. CCB-MM4]
MNEIRFDYRKENPAAFEALIQVEEAIANSSLPAKLKHLIKLRVSQINGCEFCIDMHLKEARKDGESQDRLDKLVVWSEVGLFSSSEKAALEWAEALTTRGSASDLDSIYYKLAEQFDANQIANLSLAIAMINQWNRLQISCAHKRF